jgi:hypothetical protein
MRPDGFVSALASAALLLLAGCGMSDSSEGAWAGRIDTLESGQVVVQNPRRPSWSADETWRVVEERRVGRVEGDGPGVFGRVLDVAVDEAARWWVLDGQTQEVRIFDSAGSHVRTIGGDGDAPGEFRQAVQVERAPGGRMWVVDPGNSRVSVFDTGGALVAVKPAPGGMVIFPWPGGFDDQDHYHAPVPVAGQVALVKLDTTLTALDTLETPEDPVERDFFQPLVRGGEGMVARIRVPYQGTLTWDVTPRGTLLALVTDQYRLFELDARGDTLRSFSRQYDPLPVTAADIQSVREDFERFTGEGSGIDLTLLPDTKPPVAGFFLDDHDHVWLERVTTEPELSGRLYDVFDPRGRFLGTVTLPFPLSGVPRPGAYGQRIYGVTTDSLGVQYVVRARVERP